MGPLCYRCGETKHIAPKCDTNPALAFWEQAILRTLVQAARAKSNTSETKITVLSVEANVKSQSRNQL
jgi:hypothetical protein